MKPDTVCRFLRTKKLYIPEQEDEVFASSEDGPERTPHCWCNRTLTEIGPDDQLSGIQACNPARSCFEV